MLRRRISLAVVLLLGLLLAAALVVLRAPAANGPPASASANPRERQGVCTYVYDGDTIEVAGVGKVRLIGMDAFDAHNLEKMAGQGRRYGLSPERVRDLAGQGTRRAIAALKGRRVKLRPGYEEKDDYGRVLAYVHVAAEDGGERDFSLGMIQEGLGAAFRSFDHPRLAAYLEAEEQARQAGRGMWADARLRP
jgi:micrococcal nuclease